MLPPWNQPCLASWLTLNGEKIRLRLNLYVSRHFPGVPPFGSRDPFLSCFSASSLLINKPQGKSRITNVPAGPFITALSEPDQLQTTTPICLGCLCFIYCMHKDRCIHVCAHGRGTCVHVCGSQGMSSSVLYCSPS